MDLLIKLRCPEVSRQQGSDAITQCCRKEKRGILHIQYRVRMPNRIADTGISVLTVRKHIANIYQKLHVNSKAQAMHRLQKGAHLVM